MSESLEAKILLCEPYQALKTCTHRVQEKKIKYFSMANALDNLLFDSPFKTSVRSEKFNNEGNRSID